MNKFVIGVNIEDKHISLGLVNMETRKVVSETVQRKRVDPTASADQIIDNWNTALNAVSASSEKLGIGLPGECDYDSGVLLMNDAERYNSLYKNNLKDIFSKAIGSGPENVKIMNDAVCFLQGEVFGGAGRGFKSSLGVTLGIGLGSAIYSEGVVTDANMHSYPFNEGLAEDYISIRWLLARFKELTGIEATDLSELRQLIDTEPAVAQVFEEFAINLAKFLTLFIRQHKPEVVVIGGFMEVYNRFFFDSVIAKMLDQGIRIPILRAILGEQASIIGAACAWYDAAPIHAR